MEKSLWSGSIEWNEKKCGGKQNAQITESRQKITSVFCSTFSMTWQEKKIWENQPPTEKCTQVYTARALCIYTFPRRYNKLAKNIENDEWKWTTNPILVVVVAFFFVVVGQVKYAGTKVLLEFLFIYFFAAWRFLFAFATSFHTDFIFFFLWNDDDDDDGGGGGDDYVNITLSRSSSTFMPIYTFNMLHICISFTSEKRQEIFTTAFGVFFFSLLFSLSLSLVRVGHVCSEQHG